MFKLAVAAAVNNCDDLLNTVNNLISYNVNSIRWTGDCFYALEAFIEALQAQVTLPFHLPWAMLVLLSVPVHAHM